LSRWAEPPRFRVFMFGLRQTSILVLFYKKKRKASIFKSVGFTCQPRLPGSLLGCGRAAPRYQMPRPRLITGLMEQKLEIFHQNKLLGTPPSDVHVAFSVESGSHLPVV
jgi:hypothetical protein